MEQDEKLPSYEKPPLIEVALSVQFDPITALSVPYLGLLWNEYKDRFPKHKTLPAIEPVFERFGIHIKNETSEFRIVSGEPPIRLWFIDEKENELIQVQRDRFIRNWRKVDSGDVYPRYDLVIKDSFSEDLKKFINFLKDNNLETPSFNQCEVTYVNEISREDIWDNHSELHKVFVGWSDSFVKQALLETEEINFSIKQLIKDNKNNNIGRLYINLDSVYKKESKEPVYALKLVARGKPLEDDIKSVMEFLDIGRMSIVKAFDSFPTKEFQNKWGKE